MSSRPVNPSAEAFLKAGTYLRNWSPRTVHTYRQGLWCLYQTVPVDQLPTKPLLDRWVMAMRDRGITPGGANMYIRTVNSYLSWLKESGETEQRLRVSLLKAPIKHLTLLSKADIKLLLAYAPRLDSERRTLALILLLLDCGIRIDEALGIERKRVNLDDCTLVVMGKGSKERWVPFSIEMRRVLVRWMRLESDQRFLFNTRSGLRLSYRNAFRDIRELCGKVGIKTKVHPHLFRHQFASSYIQQGGEIYRLSRLLGHTSIGTTQIYLRSMGIEQIREGIDRFSPLNVR